MEKATVVYLDELSIPLLDPTKKSWKDFEIKLRTKVGAVLKEIDPKKKNSDLKYTRQLADGKADGLHSLNLLNEYIHDHKSLPSPSELIATWDRIHPYFECLFSDLTDKMP